MQCLYGVSFREIVSFEDVERHERHDAMAVRRKFPYVIASVIDADGIDPFRIPCGEVFFPKVPAGLSGKGIDDVCNASCIESSRLGFCDFFQRIGMVLQADDFARTRRSSCIKEGIEPAGKGRIFCIDGKGFPLLLPLVSNEGRNGIAVPGVSDGRFEEFPEGKAPETAGEFSPCGRRARHGDGKPAADRHFRVPHASYDVCTDSTWGKAAAV